MDEAVEDVIRRIEMKFASLTDEVERLRADRLLLARELHRVRRDRDRLFAERGDRAAAPVDAPTRPPVLASGSTAASAVSPDSASVGPATGPEVATTRTDDVATAGTGGQGDPADGRLTDADWERLSGVRRNPRS